MENKDKFIIRQSSLTRTIEYYNMLGIKPTMMEFLATTDHIYQYVVNGMTKEVIEKTKNVDNFIKEKKS